jgi:hypothetical protein
MGINVSVLDIIEEQTAKVRQNLLTFGVLVFISLYSYGVSQKTGHCLISCDVKAIKAIAMK